MNTDITQAPPSAIMAEKSILSNMMQEPGRFIPMAAAEGLSESSFYFPGHQIFYRTIIDDFHQWGRIDLAAFVQQRSTEGNLDRMGGPSAVTDVWGYSHMGDGWTQWVSQVKQAHARRMAQEAAVKIHDADTAAAAIDELTAALDAVRKTAESPRRSLDGREATEEFLARLQEDYAAGTMPGISTGISEIDELSGGMRPGEFWVIAAKSSRGKSVLMLQFAAEFLTTGKRVAIFSIELMTKEVVGRLVSVVGRVNFGAITQPRTANSRDMEEIERAAETLAASKIHLDASAGQTLDTICAEARRIRDGHGTIDLVLVDYVQICGVDRVKNEMREREIARISAGLKQLAKELRCPVISASQLNEQGQVRESRAIEQDADALLFICEDGIKIGKLRNGKRDDLILLFLNGEAQRFTHQRPPAKKP
jgi:replicative DNA helicase